MNWVSWGIVACLIYMSFQDWVQQEVSVWALCLLSLLVSYDMWARDNWLGVMMPVVACLIWFGSLKLIKLKRGVGRCLRSPILGEGDIILFLLLALHLPWRQLPLFCIYSGTLGLMTAYGQGVYQKPFPFVPSLTGAYIILQISEP